MTNNDADNSVVIKRTVEAPIDLVWKMWTEAEHFKQWYGPMGATIPEAEINATVGGRRLVCMEMQTPNGPMKMWLTGEHSEVTPPTRLVYTESPSDEHGNIQTESMPEGFPITTEVIVELTDLGEKTNMTMTHVGVPADSPGAQGWEMALDKLLDYIASN